jgi:asparagine synthase (glutamine-hydrolysing)
MHARAVRRIGCKAVLSGEGADEILAGYSFSLCDWTGSIARSTPRPAGDCASVAAVLGFVPAWMRNAAAERVLLHALLTPEMAAEADCIDACRAAVEDVDVEGQLRGRHPVMQSLYLWARTILPGYILFSDRMEMAHGVEARLPYLDHVLFETVRKFPPRVLMAGDSSKHVLREAAAGYVNDEVARRPKQPFAAPALATGRSAVKHELRSRIRDGIGDQAFFDAAAVRACLDRLDRMEHGADVRFEPALLLIASTLALQRRYGLAA